MRDAKKKASADKAQLERDYNSLNHKVSNVFPADTEIYTKIIIPCFNLLTQRFDD